MAGPAQSECLPFYLDSAQRRLFALTGCPAGSAATHGVIVCPAFAEEMNRSRRTTRLFCGEAARCGIRSIEIDLYGTGDSSGDFNDARWETWLADLSAATEWLRRQGCRTVSLLGIRAGALLAWDVLRGSPETIHSIVLWQPVLAGRSIVTDLLRTRIAAASARDGHDTMGTLRRELAAGRSVEAAGYLLSPNLARDLEQARVGPEPGVVVPRMCWIEIVADSASGTRQPALDGVEQLRACGAQVDLVRQQDPPFWGTTEVTVGRATVARTVEWLARYA